MSFIWHMLRFKGVKVDWLQKMWKVLQSSRTDVCEAEAAGYHLEEVQS